ncbi:MAG: protoheme IX farnesyltransferase [Bacteroidota bacterium]
MIKENLKHIKELSKVRISFSVALTTFTGYLMYSGSLEPGILWPVIGIFILSAGSAALNHYQEVFIDSKMPRTQNRPLPAKTVSRNFVRNFILITFFAGTLILLYGAGWQSMLVGWLTLVWYNAVYTPLKKITAFAVVPGSIVGALPPVAGWVAAGGGPFDKFIVLVAFFFFMAQIPHFWLLLLKYGKEYHQAGLPTLTDIFSKKQMHKLTFVWMLATAATAMLIPFYGIIQHWVFILMLVAASFTTIFYISKSLLRKSFTGNTGKAFLQVNLYFLSVMAIIWADQLIR